MAQFSRTWWGQRFIAALEEFTEPARIGRGRSYASGGRILNYTLDNGTVTARVRGSINPYFGVYKEPIYTTSITIKAISSADWKKAISQIASRADLVTKLLMNEMPDTIEDAFSGLGLHLLPHSERDFVTDCPCPDWANAVHSCSSPRRADSRTSQTFRHLSPSYSLFFAKHRPYSCLNRAQGYSCAFFAPERRNHTSLPSAQTPVAKLTGLRQ